MIMLIFRIEKYIGYLTDRVVRHGLRGKRCNFGMIQHTAIRLPHNQTFSSSLLQKKSIMCIAKYRTWYGQHWNQNNMLNGVTNVARFSRISDENYIKHIRNLPVSSQEDLDKKLRLLMDIWDLDTILEVFKDSSEKGLLPSDGTFVNLMQQMANLGEVDMLLILKDIVLGDKMDEVSDAERRKRFFTNLRDAYYNTGRIEEAIFILRMMYFRERNFERVDVFFILVAVMTTKHFPEKLPKLIEFVNDCKETEDSPHTDFAPLGHLWMCYILLLDFEKADELEREQLKLNQELDKLNPAMIQKICRMSDQMVDVDLPLVVKALNEKYST